MSNRAEQGAAMLTSVTLLLILVLMALLHTSKVKMLEYRVISNYHNVKHAQRDAHNKLQLAIAQIMTSSAPDNALSHEISAVSESLWSWSETSWMSDDQQRYFHFLEASAKRAQAHSRVSQILLQYPLLRAVPQAAVIGEYGVTFNAPFLLAANPTAAPQTVLAGEGIASYAGSGSSCLPSDFKLGHCALAALSSATTLSLDMHSDMPGLQEQTLLHFFGWPLDGAEELKQFADFVHTDCSSVGNRGFIWIEGNCTLVNKTLGSASDPIILLVKNGTLKLNNTQLYGLVYLLKGAGEGKDFDSDMDNDSLIHGALIANQDLGALNGRYRVYYDAGVLNRLTSVPTLQRVSPLPASKKVF